MQPPKRFPRCRVCGQRYDSLKPHSKQHHSLPKHGPQPLVTKKLPPIAELVGPRKLAEKVLL